MNKQKLSRLIWSNIILLFNARFRIMKENKIYLNDPTGFVSIQGGSIPRRTSHTLGWLNQEAKAKQTSFAIRFFALVERFKRLSVLERITFRLFFWWIPDMWIDAFRFWLFYIQHKTNPFFHFFHSIYLGWYASVNLFRENLNRFELHIPLAFARVWSSSSYKAKKTILTKLLLAVTNE